MIMESESTHGTVEGTNSAIEQQMEELNTVMQRMQQAAVEQCKAADRMIRQYPYAAMGIAAGVGLAIGLLARRR
jgi:ElaB/YqjD/DUF883 family membrane-anchored ribosome-binding protein